MPGLTKKNKLMRLLGCDRLIMIFGCGLEFPAIGRSGMMIFACDKTWN